VCAIFFTFCRYYRADFGFLGEIGVDNYFNNFFILKFRISNELPRLPRFIPSSRLRCSK
jgi:hypothetical protein